MREVTRAQKVRLGIFLAVAGGMLLLLIGMLTGAKIFEKRDKYFVEFQDISVGGLEVGAQVKFHGVRVGRIERIFIDPHRIETVVVQLSLDDGTPVKEDVEAIISGFSLTGIKAIELTGGSNEAGLLKPGSKIPTGKSDLDMITGRAEAVSEKLELVLNNLALMTNADNQVRIAKLIDNTADLMEGLSLTINNNREKITRTADNLEMASAGIVRIVNDPSLLRAFAALDTTMTEIQAAEIGKAIADLRVALNQAGTTFTHIDLTILKGRHDIITSLEVMRESLDSFNEFTRLIAEDPSLLLRGRKGDESVGPVK